MKLTDATVMILLSVAGDNKAPHRVPFFGQRKPASYADGGARG